MATEFHMAAIPDIMIIIQILPKQIAENIA